MKNASLNALTILLLAIGIMACSENNEPEPPVATSIILVSGDTQNAMIGEALPDPVEVQLVDQNGSPIAGSTIRFEVSQGSLSAPNAISDTQGSASVVWTLGDDVAVQTLSVSADGINVPLSVNATGTLEKGDFYKGGIVFYIDDSKNHGFVCAIKDQSKEAGWGCSGTELDKADATIPGSGKLNTGNIVKGCHTAGIAAELCLNLNLNCFTDWFLPARDLMIQTAENYHTIRRISVMNGGADFSAEYYWSSSQSDSDQAYVIQLPSGISRPLPKNGLWGVRAVRAF